MASLNRVILMGNLTRDPELRYTPSGTAVTQLGLAMNRRHKTQSGEWQEEATFVEIEVWGRQAETSAQYLSKGRQALIEGRLKLDRWETKDGQKRSRLKVVAFRVVFLGSPQGAPRPLPPQEPPGQGQGQGPASSAPDEHPGSEDAGAGFDMPDEEVPF